MKKHKCSFALFGFGAIGYAIIELIWRGRTHWSMMLAGGTSFFGISKISEKLKKSCLFVKALAGCAFITALEYCFGMLFNVILKRKVWDYSKMPLNIGGQICALYSFFWFVLSLLFIPVSDKIRQKMR